MGFVPALYTSFKHTHTHTRPLCLFTYLGRDSMLCHVGQRPGRNCVGLTRSQPSGSHISLGNINWPLLHVPKICSTKIIWGNVLLFYLLSPCEVVSEKVSSRQSLGFLGICPFLALSHNSFQCKSLCF